MALRCSVARATTEQPSSSGGSAFTQYEMALSLGGGTRWVAWKRYSALAELRDFVLAKYKQQLLVQPALPAFPGKRLLGDNFEQDHVEKRRQQLDAFFRAVSAQLGEHLSADDVILTFFERPADGSSPVARHGDGGEHHAPAAAAAAGADDLANDVVKGGALKMSAQGTSRDCYCEAIRLESSCRFRVRDAASDKVLHDIDLAAASFGSAGSPRKGKARRLDLRRGPPEAFVCVCEAGSLQFDGKSAAAAEQWLKAIHELQHELRGGLQHAAGVSPELSRAFALAIFYVQYHPDAVKIAPVEHLEFYGMYVAAKGQAIEEPEGSDEASAMMRSAHTKYESLSSAEAMQKYVDVLSEQRPDWETLVMKLEDVLAQAAAPEAAASAEPLPTSELTQRAEAGWLYAGACELVIMTAGVAAATYFGGSDIRKPTFDAFVPYLLTTSVMRPHMASVLRTLLGSTKYPEVFDAPLSTRLAFGTACVCGSAGFSAAPAFFLPVFVAWGAIAGRKRSQKQLRFALEREYDELSKKQPSAETGAFVNEIMGAVWEAQEPAISAMIMENVQLNLDAVAEGIPALAEGGLKVESFTLGTDAAKILSFKFLTEPDDPDTDAAGVFKLDMFMRFAAPNLKMKIKVAHGLPLPAMPIEVTNVVLDLDLNVLVKVGPDLECPLLLVGVMLNTPMDVDYTVRATGGMDIASIPGVEPALKDALNALWFMEKPCALLVPMVTGADEGMDAANPGRAVGQLRVRVIQAENLYASDRLKFTKSSDPYAVVHIGDTWQGERKWQTRTIEETLNPVWLEEFMVEVRWNELHSQTGSIFVDLKDEDEIGKHEPLGRVKLTLSEYCDGNAHAVKLLLAEVPDADLKSTLHLELQFFACQNESAKIPVADVVSGVLEVEVMEATGQGKGATPGVTLSYGNITRSMPSPNKADNDGKVVWHDAPQVGCKYSEVFSCEQLERPFALTVGRGTLDTSVSDFLALVGLVDTSGLLLNYEEKECVVELVDDSSKDAKAPAVKVKLRFNAVKLASDDVTSQSGYEGPASKNGRVAVTFHGATGLIAMDTGMLASDGGTSDPYVRVKMEHSSPAPRFDKQHKWQRGTPTIDKTLSPNWEHVHTVDTVAGKSNVLSLQVLDYDRGASDDLIGETTLDLDELLSHTSSTDLVTRLKIDHVKGNKMLGDVNSVLVVSVAFYPDDAVDTKGMEVIKGVKAVDAHVEHALMQSGRVIQCAEKRSGTSSDDTEYTAANRPTAETLLGDVSASVTCAVCFASGFLPAALGSVSTALLGWPILLSLVAASERSRLRRAVELARVLAADEEAEGKVGFNERVAWLNGILRTAWPVYAPGVGDTIRDTIQASLTDSGVSGSIYACTLGPVAPRIKQIAVVETDVFGEAKFDVDLRFAAHDFDIQVDVAAGPLVVPVRMHGLIVDCDATVTVRFAEMVGEMRVVGVQLREPGIKFDLSANVCGCDITSIPMLSSYVDEIANNVAKQQGVFFPKNYWLPMSDVASTDPDATSGTGRPGRNQGQLHIMVSAVKVDDSGAEVYCELDFGDEVQQSTRTKHILRTKDVVCGKNGVCNFYEDFRVPLHADEQVRGEFKLRILGSTLLGNAAKIVTGGAAKLLTLGLMDKDEDEEASHLYHELTIKLNSSAGQQCEGLLGGKTILIVGESDDKSVAYTVNLDYHKIVESGEFVDLVGLEHGILELEVVEARHLEAARDADPFVRVTYGRQVAKTQTCDDTLHPVFSGDELWGSPLRYSGFLDLSVSKLSKHIKIEVLNDQEDQGVLAAAGKVGDVFTGKKELEVLGNVDVTLLEFLQATGLSAAGKVESGATADCWLPLKKGGEFSHAEVRLRSTFKAVTVPAKATEPGIQDEDLVLTVSHVSVTGLQQSDEPRNVFVRARFIDGQGRGADWTVSEHVASKRGNRSAEFQDNFTFDVATDRTQHLVLELHEAPSGLGKRLREDVLIGRIDALDPTEVLAGVGSTSKVYKLHKQGCERTDGCSCAQIEMHMVMVHPHKHGSFWP